MPEVNFEDLVAYIQEKLDERGISVSPYVIEEVLDLEVEYLADKGLVDLNPITLED